MLKINFNAMQNKIYFAAAWFQSADKRSIFLAPLRRFSALPHPVKKTSPSIPGFNRQLIGNCFFSNFEKVPSTNRNIMMGQIKI